MSDPFETNKYDTLKIKFECTSPWKSTIVEALHKLVVGRGWRIIDSTPNSLMAVVVRSDYHGS